MNYQRNKCSIIIDDNFVRSPLGIVKFVSPSSEKYIKETMIFDSYL